MAESLLLIAAFLSTVSGMSFLALAMQVHWAQVYGSPQLTAAATHKLRVRGAVMLVASLLLCLAGDHASMAVLVWVMMMSASAVLLALALAYRPRLVRFLFAPRDLLRGGV